MYEIWTQKNNNLIQIEETEDIKKIHEYHRGVYKFILEQRPKCNICGSDLKFIKKGKYLIIDKCLNENCETNNKNLKKGAPIKWKAFLPNNILEQSKQLRKFNNSFNIDFLLSKGYSEEEAKEYIKKQKEQKKIIGQKNIGKNKEYYINKVGKEEYYKQLRKRNYLCIEYWINKGYSENEAKNKISEIQQNNSKKVKNHPKINKEYIESKGLNSNLFFKERSIRCIEYYLKRGYSEDEAKKELAKIQSNYSNRVKYRKSNRQIQYWLDKGYSKDEAIKIISKLQNTFSKEKCIEKYGEEEGLKKFKERQEKWQKTLYDNHTIKCGYSKISQDLFSYILNLYNLEDRENIFYATKNKE